MARKNIYRAGLIPFIKEGDEIRMMFMKPSDPEFGGDTFQIAKGKQDDGEDIQDTAVREAGEELGLFEGNITHLEKVGEFLGRTTVFIAQVRDEELFGDPHFETKETSWMTLDEFVDKGRGLHKPVVKAAHRKILKLVESHTELREHFDTTLYEMSNFNANRTGLMAGSMLWVRTEPTGLPHTKFRFKLNHPQHGEAVFGFWGDDVAQVAGSWKLSGKELMSVRRFATLNKKELISHINGEIDSADLSDAITQRKEQVSA